MSSSHEQGASRQTISFLKKRFEEAGVRPITRYGQNFLIDLNLVQLLADSARLSDRDVVLEVGTGTGSLTAIMASRAAEVVTVEIDPQLFQLASEELSRFENVTMLRQDALRNKNQFHATVLDTVQDRLDAAPGRRLKLVANLPYNIATPIVSNLLLTPTVPFSMTVTIQKELADRISAKPRSRDYSALSIWMQSNCRVEVIRELSPAVFWPRPKVHSAILQLTPKANKRNRIADLRFYHDFVRALFLHRRKYLRSCLLSACKKQLEKPQVDALMAEQQLPPDCRAEQLTVEDMIALCDAVRAALAKASAG